MSTAPRITTLAPQRRQSGLVSTATAKLLGLVTAAGSTLTMPLATSRRCSPLQLLQQVRATSCRITLLLPRKGILLQRMSPTRLIQSPPFLPTQLVCQYFKRQAMGLETHLICPVN